MTEENKVDLEMKASAELNSSVSKDLLKEDPDQEEAQASIQDNEVNNDSSED